MNRIVKTLILGIGFTSLGALGALTTTAMAGFGPGGPGMRGQMTAIIQELNLDETQKASAQAIRDDVRELMGAQQSGMTDTWPRVAEAMEGEQPDAQALHAIVDERMASRAEATHAVLDKLLTFYGLLNEEQRQILKERTNEARQRHMRMQEAWQGEP